MAKYVYLGSHGDETWCGYSYMECYKSADTGVEVKIMSSEENRAFKRNNEIISWEEYCKIRDEKEYGQVINNYLKFSLKNREWKPVMRNLGLNIEDILSKCHLITNENDCLLNESYGIFPSRIFEIVSLLEEYLTSITDKDIFDKLKYAVNYLKIEEIKIFINLAKSDLRNADRLGALKDISSLYFSSNGNLERIRDFLLEFNSKEKGIIDFDVISNLQNSKLMNKILLSFFDYYDFNSLTRKSERNYPIYSGTNILECLAYEYIQYPHYIDWQNKRFDTRVENAVVSPNTLRLLNNIYNDKILYDLIEIIKTLDISELSLGDVDLDRPSRKLILSDSWIQYDSNNKLMCK